MSKKNGMIKVLVVKPFGAKVGEEIVQGLKGKEMMMPEGADWIKAGLVIPAGKALETASIVPPENTAKHTGRTAEKKVDPPETVSNPETQPAPETDAAGDIESGPETEKPSEG